MEEKKPAKLSLNAQEIRLIEQLRRQPQMMERVQNILQIAQSEGPLKTADETPRSRTHEPERPTRSWSCCPLT
jgi:hypothetical protein